MGIGWVSESDKGKGQERQDWNTGPAPGLPASPTVPAWASKDAGLAHLAPVSCTIAPLLSRLTLV